ncbi:MAG TPA: Ig-like domain-containing protein [Gemmatimonadales bacterium]|nr:Ig-like domain-containing protein [Gemmatimonadales bacterium]
MPASRAVHVLFLAALTASAAAQVPSPAPPIAAIPDSTARPLRKTDLIRMLTSGPLTNKQIALRVRRNCLSFTPSDRDREDLVASTADTAVMNAVAACARPGGTLRIVAPAVVHAVTGTEVPIAVRVLRWDVPVRGVSVELAGATGTPGGPTQNPGAGTDSRGVAVLRLPVGMEAGRRNLRVVLASGSEYPRASLTLVATSPSIARAEVTPGVVVFRGGVRSSAAIDVTIADSSGRPVVGVPVQIAGTTAELGPATGPPTDARGHTTIAITADSVHGSGQAGVYAAGQLVGTLTVLFQQLAVSEDRTQFIAGANQRGLVHQAARAPLVLEVRDTAGRPVPGYPVRFGVVNGDVRPASTVTDSAGIAAVQVTLGDRAGTVVITANVGRVSRQALLYATPGPAQSLEVVRDGRSVALVTITSRDTVVLRAVTRDAYGNDVPIYGIAPMVTGSAVAVRQPRTAPAGVFVLVPRKTGSSTVSLQGPGQKSEILVDVRLPPLVTGPWSFGARAGGVAFNYGFRGLSAFISGRPGFRGEVVLGREVAPRLRLQAGLGLGVLGADARSAHLSVGLYQGIVRGEYALSQSEGVVPVVALGTGVYRIKSSDPTNMVYHTSWMYLFGAGVDFPVGPKTWGIARLERQQLVEANSKYVNGAVGALTVVEVGVRVTP